MAVHLDIRPRLTIPAEPRPRARRRWRLPPLTLPAAAYWLAMAALTYGFSRLDPLPLDPPAEQPVEAARAAPPAPVSEPGPAEPTAAATAATEPAPSAEPPAPLVSPSDSEPLASDDSAQGKDPPRDREPGRRQDRPGSRLETPAGAALAEPPAPLAMNAPLGFPEFTDSTRPRPPEHAANGPRIDSLFQRADERVPEQPGRPDEPAPAPPPRAPDTRAVTVSCEAAIAHNNEQMVIGARRGSADISREAYASILQNGRYLAACSLPDRTALEICAAVKDGRAVGITVASNPVSPELNACVRRAVASLSFPESSRLDVTHTRFDALRR